MICMGLLEKAGGMQADDPPKKPKRAKKKRDPNPEPVTEKPKKQRRKKKEVSLDELLEEEAQDGPPGDFIIASKGARRSRGLVDFIVNWTLPITILTIEAMGTFWNPTWLWVAGLAIIVFNIGYLPYAHKRTIGNFVSRTRYVNRHGKDPIFLYVTIKMMTVPFIMGALILIATFAGEIQDSKEAITPFAIGVAFALVPFSDWVVLKVRHEAGQGLWDTIFGAYIVAHVPEEGAEGWLAKLEATGDYFEQKGWLSDEEGSEEDSENES